MLKRDILRKETTNALAELREYGVDGKHLAYISGKTARALAHALRTEMNSIPAHEQPIFKKKMVGLIEYMLRQCPMSSSRNLVQHLETLTGDCLESGMRLAWVRGFTRTLVYYAQY